MCTDAVVPQIQPRECWEGAARERRGSVAAKVVEHQLELLERGPVPERERRDAAVAEVGLGEDELPEAGPALSCERARDGHVTRRLAICCIGRLFQVNTE